VHNVEAPGRRSLCARKRRRLSRGSQWDVRGSLAYVGNGLRGGKPKGLDDGVGIHRQRHWMQRDPADCRLEAHPT